MFALASSAARVKPTEPVASTWEGLCMTSLITSIESTRSFVDPRNANVIIGCRVMYAAFYGQAPCGGVETGGSGGSMNWGPRAPGGIEWGPQK